MRRILSAELGTGLDDAPAPGVTTAVVMCSGRDAELEVHDPLSRKVVTRHIDVSDAAPETRARLVPIATSELVFASWSKLETDPDPQLEPEGPPAPPAARQAARDWVEQRVPRDTAGSAARFPGRRPVRRAFRVLAVVSHRAFFNHAGALCRRGLLLPRMQAGAPPPCDRPATNARPTSRGLVAPQQARWA